MSSIFNTKARRVIRYLNKDGISNIKLSINIMDIEYSLDQVVALEQHFIDTLSPNLNVDLVAKPQKIYCSEAYRNLANKENKGKSGVYHWVNILSGESVEYKNSRVSSQDKEDILRKERGTPIYIYESETLKLLYIFESKQLMYSSINIHHKTLNDCLDSGILYLNYFFLSLDLLETENINLAGGPLLFSLKKERGGGGPRKLK